MTERRVVPGRIFTPSTLHNRDELLQAFVSMLVATVPDDGDDGLQAMIGDFARNEALLPQGDQSLRDTLQELRRYEAALKDPSPQVERGFVSFRNSQDVKPEIKRLDIVIGSVISSIEAIRLERLKERPIDAEKMERLRAAMEEAVLAEPAMVPLFRNVSIDIVSSEGGELRESRINNVSKGQLLEPPMESPVGNFEGYLVDVVKNGAGWNAWNDFGSRVRSVRDIEADIEDEQFWNEVSRLAQLVGSHPLLVLSAKAEGRAILRLRRRHRDNDPTLRVEQRPPEGSKGRYFATIKDVDVFGDNVPAGEAWLFSAQVLRSIQYEKIDAAGRSVSLDFELEEEGLSGTLLARFRQRLVWADLPVFELHFPKLDPARDAELN